MKNQPDIKELSDYFAGVLPEARASEIEKALEGNPERFDQYFAEEGLSQLLKENVPAEQEPPYPDFFNSKLQQAIEGEERKGASSSAKPSLKKKKGWSWWAWPLAVGSMASCFFVGTQYQTSSQGAEMIADHSVLYTPDENVKAKMISHERGVIIMLDGLDDIPDEIDLSTVSFQHQAEKGRFVDRRSDSF